MQSITLCNCLYFGKSKLFMNDGTFSIKIQELSFKSIGFKKEEHQFLLLYLCTKHNRIKDNSRKKS